MTAVGDLDAVKRLAQFGGPALVKRMVAIFLDEAPRRMAALKAAVEQGDLPAAQAAAHSLKSSSAQLGAPAMHALSLQIEQSDDLPAIAASADQLPAELVRYQAWIAEIVQDWPA